MNRQNGEHSRAAWQHRTCFLFLLAVSSLPRSLHGQEPPLTDRTSTVIVGDTDLQFIPAAQTFLERLRQVWAPKVSPTFIDSTPGGGKSFYVEASASSSAVAGPIGGTTLVFYTGHGTPGIWDSLSGEVLLSDVLAGDPDPSSTNGKLRYLWMCSCSVFAQGPTCPVGSGGGADYACPGRFGDSGSEDAFHRWAPAWGRNLRLACGGSSLLNCTPEETGRMWDNLTQSNYDVADAFLAAAHSDPTRIPLCLAVGTEQDPGKSALYDHDFVTTPGSASGLALQPKPNLFAHFEYVQELVANPAVTSAPDPSDVRVQQQLRDLSARLSSSAPLAAAQPSPVVHLSVGPDCAPLPPVGDETQVVCRGMAPLDNPIPLPDDVSLDKDPYVTAARSFVRDHGWCVEGQTCQAPRAYRLVVDSSQVQLPSPGQNGGFLQRNKISCHQKAAIVTFTRLLVPTFTIDHQNAEITQLGFAGIISVLLNNHAQVVSASRSWQRIDVPPPTVPVSYGRALAAAQGQLGALAAHYRLDSQTWGYKAGRAPEPSSWIFLFKFVPKQNESRLKFPPREVTEPLDL